MSRKSRFEYVGEKRRAYAKSGKAKRSRILDKACETLGYTRKYVIKLLTGNIRYRERKGRGKSCANTRNASRSYSRKRTRPPSSQ